MTDILTDTLPPEQAAIRDLIEAAAALDEMTRTPGWTIFVAYAEEWRRKHEGAILSGSLTDPLDYRFHAGRLQGISQVLDIPRYVAAARDTATTVSDEWVDEFVPPASLPTHPPADEGD